MHYLIISGNPKLEGLCYTAMEEMSGSAEMLFGPGFLRSIPCLPTAAGWRNFVGQV
jgi:hypothetical protein